MTYDYFKAFSDLLSYVIKVKKRDYYSNKFVKSEDDGAKLWSTINKVFGRKNKLKFCELQLSDGTIITDDKAVASRFNRFFVDKPKKINRNIQRPVNDYGNLVPINNKSFKMLPASPEEKIKVMKKLKNGGGGTVLPVRFLKMIGEQAAVHISKLFNLSLRRSKYPSMLKIARVVPIHKRGDTRQIQNYRPISILPPLNKIFEKLIYKRMMSFVDESELLSSNQFGFRRGLDTGQAALRLIHTVLENYSRGESTACIFLDFSAAFDTLQRDILLQKCHRYGFRGPTGEFLISYLSDRKQ